MVQLIFLFDTAQDRNSVFYRWLAYHNGLKTPGKCGIFFNMLAIFFQRGRTDTMQLAPGQSGLKQV